MPIVPNFTREDIKRCFDKYLDEIDLRQIRTLQYLGEMCITHARINHTYTDQSGALTSSIGYMVFRNGVAIHESFGQVLEGAEGVKAGQNLARKVGAKYKQGISLVVTAGMNYALAVETGRRKSRSGEYYTAKPCDVLTSAEILAKKELPKLVEDLKGKLNKIV